jgi:hypothetical protein
VRLVAPGGRGVTASKWARGRSESICTISRDAVTSASGPYWLTIPSKRLKTSPSELSERSREAVEDIPA